MIPLGKGEFLAIPPFLKEVARSDGGFLVFTGSPHARATTPIKRVLIIDCKKFGFYFLNTLFHNLFSCADIGVVARMTKRKKENNALQATRPQPLLTSPYRKGRNKRRKSPLLSFLCPHSSFRRNLAFKIPPPSGTPFRKGRIFGYSSFSTAIPPFLKEVARMTTYKPSTFFSKFSISFASFSLSCVYPYKCAKP